MEEPKAAQNPPPTQDPNPPTATAAQTTPPPPQQEPPQPPAPPEQLASKKRPLENSNVNSNYFKMRLILKDLRPCFIEVLRTPDFRNCKAANEIKEKMKLLLELYKQMTAESEMKQKPAEQPQVKPALSTENKTFQSSNVSQKQQSEDGEAPGTYIVGGSAFGWNFITFKGKEPVYYGVTKESFRSAQAMGE
ncbi:hypothetical protein DITRI_Ditri11bG0153400 [Diplodiscus trichospermus]